MIAAPPQITTPCKRQFWSKGPRAFNIVYTVFSRFFCYSLSHSLSLLSKLSHNLQSLSPSASHFHNLCGTLLPLLASPHYSSWPWVTTSSTVSSETWDRIGWIWLQRRQRLRLVLVLLNGITSDHSLFHVLTALKVLGFAPNLFSNLTATSSRVFWVLSQYLFPKTKKTRERLENFTHKLLLPLTKHGKLGCVLRHQ